MLGAATGFALGTAFATARSLPPLQTIRHGLQSTALFAPFFLVREAVVSGLQVDGAVASALTGGMAGYVGSLAVSGRNWKLVGHSTMVMGVGCGLLDLVVGSLEWRRKMFLVGRHDMAVRAAAAQEMAEKVPVENEGAQEVRAGWLAKWLVWLVPLRDVDAEYEDLLRRQEATVVALEEEQKRIAVLLQALESVKSRMGRVADAELAETGRGGGRGEQCARLLMRDDEALGVKS